MQEATNSTIGAIRPGVNSTVKHEHLITIFLVRLGNQLANYQLCKLLFPGFLFTGFLVPSLFGSRLHVFPKGALVVGNSCERFACRDLC